MSSVGVRVVVRVRPANEREKREIKASSEDFAYSIQNSSSAQSISLTGRSLSAPFDAAFDNIFDSDSSQEQLFQTVALPTVQDVLNGYNGTILAYGQTGSGKVRHCSFFSLFVFVQISALILQSFTMFGAGDLVNGAQRGLIPRSTNAIFEGLRKSDCEEVTIKMSFLEIYNEVVRDLLNPNNLKLKIRERPDETVFVEGLMESYVTSEREIFSLMQVGESNRSVSATEMNAVSSRSHSLLMLTVQQKSADGSTRVGRLNFAGLLLVAN
jgi:kinesin family protein 5